MILSKGVMNLQMRLKSLSLTFSLGLGYHLLQQQQKSGGVLDHGQNECLGIIAYIGQEQKARSVCIQGLQSLSKKGYDSCGMATINQKNQQFQIKKFASENRFGGDALESLIREEVKELDKENQSIGIAHTRWATHGDKTSINAHPHTDLKQRVALVHNGIIENYQVLKEELKNAYGIEPKSQTDSEIIALLIGLSLDQGESDQKSIMNACSKLIGSYNLAILSINEPNSLYLVKNTGEMAVAYNKSKEEYIISSDSQVIKEEFGFAKAQLLENNCLIKITQGKQEIESFFLGNNEQKVQIKLKEGVQHYFIQEMLEQPEAVQKCLNYGARLNGGEMGLVKLGGLDTNESKMLEIENLLIGACGTSYHASLYGQLLMREFGCFSSVEVKIASEIYEDDFPQSRGGFLAVSQSGETTDLLNPFKIAGNLGLFRFNIVNNVESTLAREAKCGIFLNAGKEISIASTKAFVCQVVAFSLLTLWYAQHISYKTSKEKRIQLWKELKSLSEKVQHIVTTCQEFSKALGQILKDEKHIFLLGEGYGEAIAKEGSLKLKELTYKHCQAYSLSNASNGYFNYAKEIKNTPTFLIVLDDENKEKSLKFLDFLSKKTDANTFVISDIESKEDQEYIQQRSKHQFWVPYSGYLSALLCIIPIQLAVFETTFALGRDPDKPRSLTKVVL